MTDNKRVKPPQPSKLPPTVNPEYQGATMADLGRALMRPADPRARKALLRKQAHRAR